MAGNYRNILSIWFGAFISQKRKSLGIPIEEFSRAMDLSAPFLRMVENALTNVAPGRVFTLRDGLDRAFGITSQFQAVSKLLGSIQYISFYCDSVLDMKEAVKRLVIADDSLEKLLSNIEGTHWKLLEQKDQYDKLKESFATALTRDMEMYLTDPFYGSKEENFVSEKLNSYFKDIQSIWSESLNKEVTMIHEHFKSLQEYSPYFDLIYWEQQNASRITDMYGIVSHWEILRDYVDAFHWEDYLRYPKLNKIKCYIVNNYKASEVEDLYQSIAKTSKALAIGEIRKKIIITDVKKHKSNITHLFNELLRSFKKLTDFDPDNKKKYDCWIYETSGEITPVGFAFDERDTQKTKSGNAEEKTISIQNQVYRYRSLKNGEVRTFLRYIQKDLSDEKR